MFEKLTIIVLLICTVALGWAQDEKNSQYQTSGVVDKLPVFYQNLHERMTFPMSWLSGNYDDFDNWRELAKQKVMDALLVAPPDASFDPVVIDSEDRGSYIAQKVVFNLTADSRVLSYLLVPKGKGPFPAVLLLHDHGARFDIGKEKMIRPFNDTTERLASADEWVEKLYGGVYIGDELAKRGYICLATDVLNWGDRGGGEYEGQQCLNSNLMQFGMSFAGIIAHEDLRTAEYLSTVDKVDTDRISAVGLSMGSFRAFQIAALSDHIRAGIAVCWMSTVKGLVVPGNNITRGNSAYYMTHAGLYYYLDYPDYASIACPKPMMFYNGSQDKLFPTAATEDAFAKMHKVWDSQNAGDKLVTKIWDAPHVFNLDMQKEAFEWLDTQMNLDHD